MSTVSTVTQLQQLFGQAATGAFNAVSKDVFSKLHLCHTAGNGCHVYRCNDRACNHLHHQYHSCGNRHCPNCGGLKKEQWVESLRASLLPTAYYHIVFTLPHELHPIILGNRKAMFKLFFNASSQTLLQLSTDPKWLGGKCSITAVLHTWGQQLSFHPHLHCIVSGGGVDANNCWIPAKRSNGKFLFPVAVLQDTYKAKFLAGLRQLIEQQALRLTGIDAEKLIKKAGHKKWKVYAKSPFGSVDNVVAYLGRYTHKIAITTSRIKSISDHSVLFKYRDYADDNKQKEMHLSHAEFLRRFELHILPRGFVKIRHYGLLQNHGKISRLNCIREQLNLSPLQQQVQIPVSILLLEKYGKDITLCPKCKTGKLELIGIDYGRSSAKSVVRLPASTSVTATIDAPP
jgi:hypothetical protein